MKIGEIIFYSNTRGPRGVGIFYFKGVSRGPRTPPLKVYHIFVSTYNYDGGEVKFLRARGYDAFKMKGPAPRLLPFLQLPTRRIIRCASRNSKADNKILQF